MDSHSRTLLKTISYRTLGFIVTSAIAYFFTQEPLLSSGIGLADTAIKLGVYYSHERIWCKIPFGTVKPSKDDYQI
ncbi:MAG: DUF2061 domain-containing protein [Chloroflexi bacterium]|nr:DUF2061 domain-containing protein [Chloroflexota bacterium]